MCTGLEIAALTSIAGGSYLQYDAARDSADAMNDAAKAEAIRQARIDDEKAANFAEALKLAERGTQQEAIDKAASERKELMQSVSDLPTDDGSYVSPAAGGQPRIVREHAEREAQDAQDFVSLLGRKRADVGAWEEGMYEFGDKLGDFGWWTDELNRRSGRSAQIGAQEAQLAGQQAGQGKALAGNIFAGMGTAAMGPLAYKRVVGAGGAGAGAITPDMFDAVATPRNYYVPSIA